MGGKPGAGDKPAPTWGRSIRADGRQQARARLAERLSKERSKGTKRAGGAAGKKAILRGQPARGVWAFGRKIGTRNGNVSCETSRKESIRGRNRQLEWHRFT